MSAVTRSELPVEVADVLRPVVPALADEVVAAIGCEIDAYRRPLEGPFGQAVRAGTVTALYRFLDHLGDPSAQPGGRFYVSLGEAEFHQGRSLDSLLAAYRLGARLAWRRYSEACEDAGLEPRVVYRIGEAIFAYIDELSAESAEGYAQAQSAAAGEREQRRRHAVELLLREPPAEERVVRTAAEEAGWTLPARLAAMATTPQDESRLASRLGPGAIAARVEDLTLALVPDPDGPGRRRQLVRAVKGLVATLGPTVDWADAARSVRRARLAHRLATTGVLAGDVLLVADQHLPTLLLHADPALSHDLAERYLAPLAGQPAPTRAKLTRTLRAWLDHRGKVEEAARELGVHPQTVRYRLRQLRGLFGKALEDPEERLALGLALRAGGD